VRASLALAWGELGLAEVGAFTRPANRASARVLQKCGFAFVRHVPALERDQYRVTPRSRAAP
jgi:RimJ/RimL family protein N-acetyltransferase